MPPSKKLDVAVVRDFETWIRLGAPYPKAAKSGGKYYVTIKQGRNQTQRER